MQSRFLCKVLVGEVGEYSSISRFEGMLNVEQVKYLYCVLLLLLLYKDDVALFVSFYTCTYFYKCINNNVYK